MNSVENKVKLISHGSLATPRVRDYKNDFDATYQMRSFETVLKGNRYVKKVIYNTVDQVEYMKGLNAYDFALENIIAVGALNGLKDCQITDSVLSDVDRTSVSAENLVSAVSDADVNK